MLTPRVPSITNYVIYAKKQAAGRPCKARAVSNTHPQVALDIWKGIVDTLIGKVKPRAYEEAASYLRLMEKIYSKYNRLADWQGLIRDLRNKHRQKRRLLGTLDNLTKKTIVD